MKAHIYLFLVLLTGILFTSCKKDNIAYKSDFNKSSDAWINFKASSGNSYRYGISSSSWTGYSTATTVTIKNGKVVQRSFVAKAINRTTNQTVVVQEWSEAENQLGSHEGVAPLWTLDDIYKEAKDNWLRKRSNTDTYFEAKNNGMISSCGFVDKNCQDDCFQGIHINFIEKM